MENLQHDYPAFLSEIKFKIRQAQYAAMKAVNTQLVHLYWEIGRSIAEKQQQAGWGKSVVENLARDLQAEFPGMRGISARNLWLMADFYDEYHQVAFLQSLIAEISWTHHTVILSKCKDNRERQFYIGAAKKFGWTSRVLSHQIDNKTFEKYLLNQTNFDATLPEKYQNQAILAVKDHYNFDFLELSDEHSEHELELALIQNIRRFLLEMGSDFCFVGNQYRLEVEDEQNGQDRAKYGSKLLHQLSKDLTLKHKKGFSRSNVNYMRLYKQFPIVQTLSVQLAWGHYCELLSLDDELERSFYVKQCEIEGWAVHELRRQIKSMLFHRLALSKDKEGVLALSREGHRVQNPSDLLREPFMLEFLGIPEKPRYKEKHLETRIITFLQDFLLEMGKGFAFIGRQYRIQIDGDFYRIDLLFYHRILKCFVIIDLKTGTAGHRDVGQMNMYLNYFKTEENQPDDNEPIGIILAANKSKLAIEYALGGLSTQIFVSRYQLYLPDRQLLEEKLQNLLEP